jgi:hypothetical protein
MYITSYFELRISNFVFRIYNLKPGKLKSEIRMYITSYFGLLISDLQS